MATSWVGPISRNSARGRRFSSSAVSMIAAPPEVLLDFFGTSTKNSRTSRGRVPSRAVPKTAATIARNQLPAASSIAGWPITSGSRSLLKMPSARRTASGSRSRSGSKLCPWRMRSRQSRRDRSIISARGQTSQCRPQRSWPPPAPVPSCRPWPAWPRLAPSPRRPLPPSSSRPAPRSTGRSSAPAPSAR